MLCWPLTVRGASLSAVCRVRLLCAGLDLCRHCIRSLIVFVFALPFLSGVLVGPGAGQLID